MKLPEGATQAPAGHQLSLPPRLLVTGRTHHRGGHLIVLPSDVPQKRWNGQLRRGGSGRTGWLYIIHGMSWGTVELEPEVRDWLEGLSTTQFATAVFYVDLLAEQGPLLGEPYTRQLDRKLRELRFHLGGRAVRVTDWITSGRRIVLLTVFAKTRMGETREIDRAREALERCIAAEHTADEDDEE